MFLHYDPLTLQFLVQTLARTNPRTRPENFLDVLTGERILYLKPRSDVALWMYQPKIYVSETSLAGLQYMYQVICHPIDHDDESSLT